MFTYSHGAFNPVWLAQWGATLRNMGYMLINSMKVPTVRDIEIAPTGSSRHCHEEERGKSLTNPWIHDIHYKRGLRFATPLIGGRIFHAIPPPSILSPLHPSPTSGSRRRVEDVIRDGSVSGLLPCSRATCWFVSPGSILIFCFKQSFKIGEEWVTWVDKEKGNERDSNWSLFQSLGGFRLLVNTACSLRRVWGRERGREGLYLKISYFTAFTLWSLNEFWAWLCVSFHVMVQFLP